MPLFTITKKFVRLNSLSLAMLNVVWPNFHNVPRPFKENIDHWRRLEVMRSTRGAHAAFYSKFYTTSILFWRC